MVGEEMGKALMKSWFTIDGDLPEIDYPEDASYRYPEQLVEHIVGQYSKESDWILDPFCGFGTTLTVCSRMKRNSVGFEKNERLYRYVQSRIAPPSTVVLDNAKNIASYPYPKFDLLLTSPPFRTFRDNIVVDHDHYYEDLVDILKALRPTLAIGAHLVIESANFTSTSGNSILRAFRTALALSSIYTFVREHVCCNMGATEVVPGYQHSYLLVFRNEIGCSPHAQDRTIED